MGVLSWVYLTEKTFRYIKLGTSVFFTKMTMPGKKTSKQKKGARGLFQVRSKAERS